MLLQYLFYFVSIGDPTVHATALMDLYFLSAWRWLGRSRNI